MTYRVYFQVTSDFFEVVNADDAEKAVDLANVLADDTIQSLHRYASIDKQIVKIEPLEDIECL